jgi:hypothetical protein
MLRRQLNLLTALSLLLCVTALCVAGCARRGRSSAARIPEVALSDDELAEAPLSVAGVEELRRYVVPIRVEPRGRKVTIEGRAVAGDKSPNDLIVPWWADADWAHVIHMGGLLAPGLDGRRIRVRMTLREGEALYDPDAPGPRPAMPTPRTAATRPYRHRYLYLHPDPDAVLVGLWDGRQWQPRRQWLSPETAAQYRDGPSTSGE